MSKLKRTNTLISNRVLNDWKINEKRIRWDKGKEKNIWISVESLDRQSKQVVWRSPQIFYILENIIRKSHNRSKGD